jgi:hypothetical protein
MIFNECESIHLLTDEVHRRSRPSQSTYIRRLQTRTKLGAKITISAPHKRRFVKETNLHFHHGNQWEYAKLLSK